MGERSVTVVNFEIAFEDGDYDFDLNTRDWTNSELLDLGTTKGAEITAGMWVHLIQQLASNNYSRILKFKNLIKEFRYKEWILGQKMFFSGAIRNASPGHEIAGSL